jgi:hypothetical protein
MPKMAIICSTPSVHQLRGIHIMYDFETRQKFITRRALGKSLNSIAAELGIHKNTARTWNTANKAEIEAERRNYVGVALAAEGAGRIERARISAALFNRLTKKLLEEASQTAQLDAQSLGAYIKLCQLLDKADPPLTPEPGETGCDLPDTIDLLANVKKPSRPGKMEQPEPIRDLYKQAQLRQQSEKEKTEDVAPANRDREAAPEPIEVNTEKASRIPSESLTGRDRPAESGEGDSPEMHTETQSTPDEESLAASEEFWRLYREKMGRN